MKFKINHNKNKKGISEIIAYVLLVVMVISLASATFFWLQGYAKNPLPEEACPEGVSVIITDSYCKIDNDGKGKLDLTIKNNGRFNLDGIIITFVNDTSTNFEYKLYTATNQEYPLEVTNETEINDLPFKSSDTIKKIIIYPYITDEKGFNNLCENAISKVEISACEETDESENDR